MTFERRAILSLAEEALKEGRVLGGGPASPAGALGGYFVVSARDYDAALAIAIARSCPHLKHGGTIEVRAIEET